MLGAIISDQPEADPKMFQMSSFLFLSFFPFSIYHFPYFVSLLADVEELSTKLMAKLAEVQSLDGGTFFIGNADALRGLPASAMTPASTAQSGLFQPQHVLLPGKCVKGQAT